MWQRLVKPKQVNQANLILRHCSKGREYSWRHLTSGYHQSAAYRRFRAEQQQALALSVALGAIVPLRGLGAA